MAATNRKRPTHQLPCTSCRSAITRHSVRASFHHEVPVEDDGATIGYIETDYEVVQCNGCGQPSFRSFWYASNTPPEYFKLPPDHEQLYPPRLADRRRRDDIRLPESIQLAYFETHKALCSGSNVLTIIGMRAILEAVCRHQGVRKGLLWSKVDKLVEKGVLSRKGANVLHGVRSLGNDAAHEVKPADQPKLLAAMDTIENLLESVYLIAGDHRKLLPPKRYRKKKK